jgi:hypothetical protein
MLTLTNMLDTAAAAVLSGDSAGCHITDRQLIQIGMPESSLRTWAQKAGVTVTKGELGRRPGWWIRRSHNTTNEQ